MEKSIDIGKSFTHIFDDPEWSTKVILGALVALVPILNFTLAGYEVQLVRNMRKGEPRPMPAWDGFGDFFTSGLLLSLARIIYGLPLLLLVAPFFLFFFVMLFLPILAVGAPDEESMERLFGLGFGAGFLVMFCSIGLGMVYSLIYGFISPAVTSNYVQRGTFAACFDLKEIFAFIRRNFNNYLMVWVAAIGAGLLFTVVYTFVAFIPCLGSFLAIPLSAAGAFYIYMVSGHALGQAMAFDTPPTSVEPVQSAG